MRSVEAAAAGRLSGRASDALKDGDPTAVGLLTGVMTVSTLFRLAKQVARPAISDGEESLARRQRFQRVEDADERFRRLKSAGVDFLHIGRTRRR
jgi:hypothetical protein